LLGAILKARKCGSFMHGNSNLSQVLISRKFEANGVYFMPASSRRNAKGFTV
jgi:hypothetical protein